MGQHKKVAMWVGGNHGWSEFGPNFHAMKIGQKNSWIKKTKCWFYHVLSCFIQQTCWNIQPTKSTFEWLSALATKGHCSFAVRRNSSEPEKSSAAVPQCLTPEAVTPRFRRCRIVLQCCSAYAESMCIFVHYTYNRGYNIIYIYIK